MTRIAECRCGQLRIACRGEPVRISVCHCLACQRRTGSAFGTQARFPRGQVEIAGQATEWIRTADSGNRIAYHFCPRCGATVWYASSAEPGLVAVPVGAFADPAFPPPQRFFHGERRHRWVRLAGDGPPPPEPRPPDPP